MLNEMYCSMLQGQLSHYEKKRSTPKGMGKLVGDGLPRLLFGDEFYEQVVEFTDRQRRAEKGRAEKNEARDGRVEAMKVWHKTDEAECVETADIQGGEDRVGNSKEGGSCTKKQFGVPAPKLGKCLSPYPKPAVAVPLRESKNKS